MQIIYTSRRQFLKNSVALCIYASSSFGSKTFSTNKKENSTKNIPYLCNMCRNKCAGFAKVENGKVIKLNPNQFFPKSRNMLCPKGNAGIDALYDKDRLKYPLIRIGKRGDGKFKAVTWDEAYTYIKNKLVNILDEQKDNRSTISYCNGEGFNKDELINFFGDKLGSSNFLDEGSICLNTKLGAMMLTIGDIGEMDIAGSDYVVIIGANRFESLITPDSIDLINKTQNLVVIDPRATTTAIKANTFLPINPGTDLALCLAIIYISIKDKLYNKAFVKQYFKDFDKLKKHILKEKYTALWASEKTNIPAIQIEKLAKDFFSAKNPLFYMGRRSVWAKNDFQLRRAMVLINALKGSINKKGGIIFGKSLKLPQDELNTPIYANAKDRFDLDGIVYGSTKGGSWLNFREKVINKTSPYPIKAMFIRKHNIMQNMPNINKTKKMLQMLDLIVVLDTMPSDTAMMADIILPECTYLEREDLAVSFNRLEPSIAIRNQVIKPMYESRSMQDILKGLGEKLSIPLFNLSKKYDEDLQESIKDIGEKRSYIDGGYDLTELYKKDIKIRNKELIIKSYGKDAYKNLKEKGVWYPNMEKYHKYLVNHTYRYYPENKKYYTIKRDFKVNCYLKKLKKHGFDPMPSWRDEYDFKVKLDRFRLLTGRYIAYTQSATTNNSMLRDIIPTNHIWINNKKADKLGIKNGDVVKVSSDIGSISISAYPTNKIHPDVVWFAHGFESDNQALSNISGASDNEIIKDSFEKIYGCATMHHTDVQIRKI